MSRAATPRRPRDLDLLDAVELEQTLADVGLDQVLARAAHRGVGELRRARASRRPRRRGRAPCRRSRSGTRGRRPRAAPRGRVSRSHHATTSIRCSRSRAGPSRRAPRWPARAASSARAPGPRRSRPRRSASAWTPRRTRTGTGSRGRTHSSPSLCAGTSRPVSSHSGTAVDSHVWRSWSLVEPFMPYSICSVWRFIVSGSPNHSSVIGNIQSIAACSSALSPASATSSPPTARRGAGGSSPRARP